MSSSKKYIHYGHDRFDRNLFVPILNRALFVKPFGGLWASPVDAAWGWKQWCESENFHKGDMRKSFTFTLTDDANVIHIRSVDGLNCLPKQGPYKRLKLDPSWYCIDFERLLSEGVDAIELHLSEEDHIGVDFLCGLYWQLYGWDCDSILIMNPEVVSEDVML